MAASLLLIDPAPIALAPQLGFVAGVALARLLTGHLEGRAAPKLKWPNDLVFGSAKLSGLLLEAAQLSDGRLACVIGFGVNVVDHPDGLPYPTTDLKALGIDVTARELLEKLRVDMALWLHRWQGGQDFAAVRSAWLANAAGLGELIRIVAGHRTIEGRFRTIDAAGQLILDTQAGPETVAAGDVFLLPKTG